MKYLLLSLVLLLCLPCSGQFFPKNAAQADSIYQLNIKKTRINGVYIPKNIEEAISEMEALTDPQALIKFKLGDESEVARKLYFGLGRWIRYNWNLQEGSRLAEVMRQQGIHRADDQSDALIRLLHRKLNDKPADIEGLAKHYEEAWKKKKEAQIGERTVLSIDTLARPRQ